MRRSSTKWTALVARYPPLSVPVLCLFSPTLQSQSPTSSLRALGAIYLRHWGVACQAPSPPADLRWCGGGWQAKGYGAPELVSCGRDGCVRVWDVRQKDAPVAAFEPGKEDRANPRDCWTVAFGNSFNDEERCVLAGYDNGDVKLFDLRTNKWVAPMHAYI